MADPPGASGDDITRWSYVCKTDMCNTAENFAAATEWAPAAVGCWEGAIGFGAMIGCNVADKYKVDGNDEYFDEEVYKIKVVSAQGVTPVATASKKCTDGIDWAEELFGEPESDGPGPLYKAWCAAESSCKWEATMGQDYCHGKSASDDSTCNAIYGRGAANVVDHQLQSDECTDNNLCEMRGEGECQFNDVIKAKKEAWEEKFRTLGVMECRKRGPNGWWSEGEQKDLAEGDEVCSENNGWRGSGDGCGDLSSQGSSACETPMKSFTDENGNSIQTQKCKLWTKPQANAYEAECTGGADDLCSWGIPKVGIPAKGTDSYDMVAVPTTGLAEHGIPALFTQKAAAGDTAKCFTAVMYKPSLGAYFVAGNDSSSDPVKTACIAGKAAGTMIFEHIDMTDAMMTDACNSGIIFGTKEFMKVNTVDAFVKRVEEDRFKSLVENYVDSNDASNNINYKDALTIVRQFKDANDNPTFKCAFFGGAPPMPGFPATVGAGGCVCTGPYCNDGKQVQTVLSELASVVIGFMEADFKSMATGANGVKAGLAIQLDGAPCTDQSTMCTMNLAVVATLTTQQIDDLSKISGMDAFLQKDQIAGFVTDLADMHTSKAAFRDSLPQEIKDAKVTDPAVLMASNAVVPNLFDMEGNLNIDVAAVLTDQQKTALGDVSGLELAKVTAAGGTASTFTQEEAAAALADQPSGMPPAGADGNTPGPDSSPAAALVTVAAGLALLAL